MAIQGAQNLSGVIFNRIIVNRLGDYDALDNLADPTSYQQDDGYPYGTVINNITLISGSGGSVDNSAVSGIANIFSTLSYNSGVAYTENAISSVSGGGITPAAATGIANTQATLAYNSGVTYTNARSVLAAGFGYTSGVSYTDTQILTRATPTLVSGEANRAASLAYSSGQTYTTSQGYITASSLVGLSTSGWVNQSTTSAYNSGVNYTDAQISTRPTFLNVTGIANSQATLGYISGQTYTNNMVLNRATSGSVNESTTSAYNSGVSYTDTQILTRATPILVSGEANRAASLAYSSGQTYTTSQGYITSSSLNGLATSGSVNQFTTSAYNSGVTYTNIQTTGLAAGSIINAKHFGCLGNGVAMDTTGLTNFFNYLKTNGGIGKIPSGTYLVDSAISVTSGLPFKIIGDGREVTIIRRAGNIGTLISVEHTNDVGFEGITLDINRTGFPTNASHGVAMYRCNNGTFRDMKILNHENTAILYYTDLAGTYRGGIFDNVYVDGYTGANNGLMFEGMDWCAMRHCYVRNCTGSPGIGLQLKNNCRYSSIEDCFVEYCNVGIGFGQDTNLGVEQSRVNNVSVLSCNYGFNPGFAKNNIIQGITINNTGQPNIGLDGIRLQNCTGNVIIGVMVMNVTVNRSSIRLDNSTDNLVHINLIHNGGGNQVAFTAGSERNTVKIDHISSPLSDNLNSIFSDSSAVTTNVLELAGNRRTGGGSVYNLQGSGSPSGTVSAPVGSIYRQTDGGANSTLWVKEAGTSTAGWVAK